ncbi:MAG TPA: DNA-processing protein DprA [Gaiellaceae bacterium]|jgi:DNA processing protein|nr:DNA-processing protein DprA [Gaiellaceae bacterium]
MSELAVAVFASRSDAHLLEAPRSARFAAFRQTFDERGYLRELAGRGFRWVARSDPQFPARLRAIHDPPAGLFVRGDAPLSLLDGVSVAVVGARACSPYGIAVATSLGRELAAAGVIVVSGLARGVDGAAHRGALDTGLTIAVLGCGIDRDYPRAHASLAAEIARDGLILSEYPPGVEPAPWRFPARNRIVAGLASATVVVEARERSGALITTDLALEEGREVFAVPGEITSQLSHGTNSLLRLGATPVTCAADVLTAIGVEPAPPRRSATLVGAPAAVHAIVADGAAGVDDISRRANLPAAQVAAALTELELLGLVTNADGVYREVMRPT